MDSVGILGRKNRYPTKITTPEIMTMMAMRVQIMAMHQIKGWVRRSRSVLCRVIGFGFGFGSGEDWEAGLKRGGSGEW